MQPMDPQNDPLWKMGQQGEQQHAQRAQQIAQGWANKEQYYQNVLFRMLGLHLPLAIAKVLWKFARSVFFIYFAPPIGVVLAGLCFFGAITLQGGEGFFSLGLGLGTLDAILFVVGAAFVLATLAGVVWGFYTMTWFCQILVLFYVYSLGILVIHDFEPEIRSKTVGAWFFCVVLSSLIEGVALWIRNRRAGVAI